MTETELQQQFALAHRYAEQHDYAQAAPILAQILNAFPRQAESLALLALICLALGQTAEAAQLAARSVQANPDYAHAHYAQGQSYEKQAQFAAAKQCYQRAFSLEPKGTYRFALAHLAQIAAQSSLDLLAAVKAYDDYLRDEPNNPLAYHNRADLLKQLGLYQLALQDAERCLVLSPDYALGHCNKAFILNMLGDYQQGWKHYEWRWKTGLAQFQRPNLPFPEWQGETLDADHKLLIYAEQGLGDNLQFVRLAIEAQQRGLNVVVVNHSAVEGLINANLARFNVASSPNGGAISGVTHYVSMMSLPHCLGITLQTIPFSQGYLQAQPEFIAKWQPKLPGCSALKVGLVWAGSPKHDRNSLRSLAFEQLSRLFGLPAEFHCLQKAVSEADLAQAARYPNLHFWHNEIDDFSDTAALVAQMDLVISVDTSVAHLAAAMGKPTWILLSYHPDFRWLAEGEQSPWYQSAHLFRQDLTQDWQPVIAQVCARLAQTIKEQEND